MEEIIYMAYLIIGVIVGVISTLWILEMRKQKGELK